MTTARLALFAFAASLLSGCGDRPSTDSKTAPAAPATPAATAPVPAKYDLAVVSTTEGEMTFELYSDKAPGTVANFEKLAKAGFYDNTAFHRIIRGFMIQGGDPKTKEASLRSQWGTGGPGYTIKAEFNDTHHTRGVLSMARSMDPDSAGSQFFICDGDAPHLDGKYTAFGKLVKGDDVLSKIATTSVTYAPSGEPSAPVKRIAITGVTITPAAK